MNTAKPDDKGDNRERQRFYLYLISIVDLINQRQKIILNQFGITHSQFNILRILKGVYPNSINLKELQTRMVFGRPDITRLVDRLVLKELARRATNTIDKRKIDIMLTPRGQEFLEALSPKMESTVNNFFERDLTENQAAQLNDALDRIKRSLLST